MLCYSTIGSHKRKEKEKKRVGRVEKKKDSVVDERIWFLDGEKVKKERKRRAFLPSWQIGSFDSARPLNSSSIGRCFRDERGETDRLLERMDPWANQWNLHKKKVKFYHRKSSKLLCQISPYQQQWVIWVFDYCASIVCSSSIGCRSTPTGV